MAYIIFGAVIFWVLFIGTPTEILVLSLVLFAINCIKMIRIIGEIDRKEKRSKAR